MELAGEVSRPGQDMMLAARQPIKSIRRVGWPARYELMERGNCRVRKIPPAHACQWTQRISAWASGQIKAFEQSFGNCCPEKRQLIALNVSGRCRPQWPSPACGTSTPAAPACLQNRLDITIPEIEGIDTALEDPRHHIRGEHLLRQQTGK